MKPEDILTWLKGKKTYIIALVIMVIASLQAFDIFMVPEWAWAVLAALGLSSIRAGVTKVEDAIKPEVPE